MVDNLIVVNPKAKRPYKLFTKKYFIIIDVETTKKDHVADFAAVVVDRSGNIQTKMGVLVSDYYGKEDLFFDNNNEQWNKASQERRAAVYADMLNSGARRMASVAAINRWLLQAAEKYNPTVTAYNVAFDLDKCKKSMIDLTVFELDRHFCLWKEAARIFAHRKDYINFCIKHKCFSPAFNMRTNAEVMSHYLSGKNVKEPHLALEDIIDHELIIFKRIMAAKKGIKHIAAHWSKYQGRNLLTAA